MARGQSMIRLATRANGPQPPFSVRNAFIAATMGRLSELPPHRPFKGPSNIQRISQAMS